MKFTIQITETLQKLVDVDACSAADAERIVLRRYRSGEIVLDSADHVGTTVDLSVRPGDGIACAN